MQTCSRCITEGFATQPRLMSPFWPVIMNRMQEIGFNSALIREIRAVAFVTKLIDEGRLANGKRMLIHVIEAEDVIRELLPSSR